MNILLTGGAGYLGSVLVPTLLAAGHRVRVLDLFRYEPLSLAACAADPGLEIVRGDVRDVYKIAPATEDMEMIIHLAALVGAPACDAEPETAWSINHGA